MAQKLASGCCFSSKINIFTFLGVNFFEEALGPVLIENKDKRKFLPTIRKNFGKGKFQNPFHQQSFHQQAFNTNVPFRLKNQGKFKPCWSGFRQFNVRLICLALQNQKDHKTLKSAKLSTKKVPFWNLHIDGSIQPSMHGSERQWPKAWCFGNSWDKSLIKHQVKKEAVHHLLCGYPNTGGYSILFLFLKKNWDFRAVLNLNWLNLFVEKREFKMETSKTIIAVLEYVGYMTSIDLTESYLHIPIKCRDISWTVQSSSFCPGDST